MNFEKTRISKSIGTLLRENLRPEDVETLNRVLQGKKAQYNAANSLIRSVLQALVNRNEEEDTEENAEENSEENFSQGLTQQEGHQNQNEVFTNREQQADKDDLIINEETPTQTTNKNQDSKTKDEDVCKFYKNGRCKFGKECRKPHPAFCPTFTKWGPRSHNPRGCENKCGKTHTNICRQSLRTKECVREDCRLYHLKGTKRP